MLLLQAHLPFPPSKRRLRPRSSSVSTPINLFSVHSGQNAVEGYGILPELAPGTRLPSPVPFARPADPATLVNTPENMSQESSNTFGGALGMDEEPAEVRRRRREASPASPEHVEFFAKIAYSLWYQTHSNVTSTTLEKIYEHVPDPFHAFLHRVTHLTRLPLSTLVLGIFYLAKLSASLSKLVPIRKPGSELRALTVCLILANKFLDDITYTYKTWGPVTQFTSSDMHQMEMEVLELFQWNSNVSAEEWSAWIKGLERVWWCREVMGWRGIIQSNMEGLDSAARVIRGPNLWRSCMQAEKSRIAGPLLPETGKRKRTFSESITDNGHHEDDRTSTDNILIASDPGFHDVRLVWMTEEMPNSSLGVGDGILLPRAARRRRVQRSLSIDFGKNHSFEQSNVHRVMVLPPDRLGLLERVPKSYEQSAEHVLAAYVTFVDITKKIAEHSLQEHLDLLSKDKPRFDHVFERKPSITVSNVDITSPTIEVRQDLFKFRIGRTSLIDEALRKSLPSSRAPSTATTPGDNVSVRTLINHWDSSDVLQRPVSSRQTIDGALSVETNRSKKRGISNLGLFSETRVTMVHRQDSRTVKQRMGFMISDEEDIGASSGGL